MIAFPHQFPDPSFPDPQKLLVSSREAAKILAISERTLWTLTKIGRIPFVQIGGAKRYAIADLLRFIEQQRRSN
jgi:excisionase family DNA binding protein